MSPARKDDESVQTSLRELMNQEEERVRQERERLEQLRLAKARIDQERAEAAREAEELRRKRDRDEEAEREAKRAAAIEAARVEALAKAQAEPRVVVVREPAPPPKSKLGAGVLVGIAIASVVAALAWLAFGAPRIARAAESVTAMSAELERERARSREEASLNEAALEDGKREVDSLRAENERLRRATPSCPKAQAIAPPPRQRVAPSRPCDPRDPLCGDLR